MLGGLIGGGARAAQGAEHGTKASDRLAAALAGFRGALAGIMAISGVVNTLALTGSFYMLQVYDRVLTSHSVPTLVALSVLAIGLYLFLGALDVIRAQALVRIGSAFDERISPVAHAAVMRLPIYGASTTEATQPLRDVDAIRQFLSNQGPIAILDLPWMPLYLIFVFLLHIWLGALALLGVVVLIALTWHTERLTQGLNASASRTASARMGTADANARNAEVLRAMGIGARATRRFEQANAQHLATQTKAADVGGGLSGLSRVLRMVLQSAMLGLGAYLTIRGQLSAGGIIAASIASSRALAPIELAITHWKSFVAARQSYARLTKTLDALPKEVAPLQLPPPTLELSAGRRDGADFRHAAPRTQYDQLRIESRAGAGADRTQRRRQIVAGPRHYRRVAIGARGGTARRSRARPLVDRGAGLARRLPAARRGVVRRHHCRERGPLRGSAR